MCLLPYAVLDGRLGPSAGGGGGGGGFLRRGGSQRRAVPIPSQPIVGGPVEEPAELD